MSKEHALIRLFFVKMKPEFFRLSQDEQSEFVAKDRENLDSLGMKAISMIDCSGSSDRWEYVGVEGWPSESALKEREKFEADVLKISDFIEYETIIGKGQSFEDYGKG